MISLPLFKQSCKANFVTWAFVTIITCVMISAVIIILGSLRVNSIQTSMMNMLIADSLESTVEEYSMKSYAVADNTLRGSKRYYTKARDFFLNQTGPIQDNEYIVRYNDLITSGMTDTYAKAEITKDKDELESLAINLYIDFYLTYGTIETTTEEELAFLVSNITHKYYDELIKSDISDTTKNTLEMIVNSIDDYLNGSDTSAQDFASELIPNVMAEVLYTISVTAEDQTFYVKDFVTKDQIFEVSYTAIVSYRAQMDIRERKIIAEFKQTPEYETMNETQRQEYIDDKLAEYQDTTIASISESILGALPEEVSNSLLELVSMDVYGLVIGSLFYKIAGLLLPIVYIIMTANSIIAGQVDNGSMAYVLSTPTKRLKVTLTQFTFLTLSLLAMFSIISLVSVLSLLVVSGGGISITIPQMLLLNLGAFVTCFALAGICFLASAWFNRSKYALGIGGGISMFFLVCTILGLFGSASIPQAIRIESMNYFNYMTLISLFNTTSILGGTTSFVWQLFILLGIGLLTAIIGMIRFNKKDLPL